MLETQLADLENECSRLLRTLEQVKSEREQARIAAEKQRETAEKETSKMTTELETARSKVKLYADYDEIKRELEIMKVRFCGFGNRLKSGSDMALS